MTFVIVVLGGGPTLLGSGGGRVTMAFSVMVQSLGERPAAIAGAESG